MLTILSTDSLMFNYLLFICLNGNCLFVPWLTIMHVVAETVLEDGYDSLVDNTYRLTGLERAVERAGYQIEWEGVKEGERQTFNGYICWIWTEHGHTIGHLNEVEVIRPLPALSIQVNHFARYMKSNITKRKYLHKITIYKPSHVFPYPTGDKKIRWANT